jgi:glycosyltransferase involved in cell wall biosynthesis
VPTRGRPRSLLELLEALKSQTVSTRHELIVAFDGDSPHAELRSALENVGARLITLPERRGPGAARNAAVREARADWLAFTEDDCVPARDWLELAARRIESSQPLDAFEGATLLPNGSPVRRRHRDRLSWLPTNLFVRRSVFEKVGGYCESYFDPRTGIYFREDSDFGFTLADAGARTVVDESIRVTHPREHPSWLDPIRWARRYEMDPLLEARHPVAFRDEIEVISWGPFRFRRLFVRLCAAFLIALVTSGAAALLGASDLAAGFLTLVALLVVAVWAKWRFDPRKLPSVLIVPLVLMLSLVWGRMRVQGMAGPRPSSAR